MSTRRRRHVDGILLLHNGVYPGPPDVADSVRAFRRFSRFPVFPVDAFFGYPEGLDRMHFQAVVLHYTMFYIGFAPLNERFRAFLAASEGAFKVALFQDEQAYLPERVKLCSTYGIDCVFTCLQPPYSDRVYARGGRSRVVSYLPGYVSDRLRAEARKLTRPAEERAIDIGYRGRRPPREWGGPAAEKYEIAVEFKRRAENLDLVFDIETDEDKRIYGRAWPRFISRCKAMLGTESGAVIPEPGGHEEDQIPYRTISPRHFEAAALGTCQILYEGEYSGILEPMVHYIPLKKDFSNFDEVIARFRRPELRAELTENAFRDLIASDRFAYSAFIRGFDAELAAAGLEPTSYPPSRREVSAMIYPPRSRARRSWKAARLAARLVRRRLAAKRAALARSGG